MTGGLAGWLPLRSRILLCLVGPAIVLTLGALAGLAARSNPSGQASLDSAERRIGEAVDDLLGRAAALADAALSRGPAVAGAALSKGALRDRLEGIALLDTDLELLEWEGQPSDPPEGFGWPEWPRWVIRQDGVRTRLLVRAGPDERGTLAAVSLIVDSSLDDFRVIDLLPSDVSRGCRVNVRFVDTENLVEGGHPSRSTGTTGPENVRTVELRTPDDELLAFVDLTPLPADRLGAGLRRTSRAWAVLFLCLLIGVLFDWRAVATRWNGLAAVIALVAAGRWALAWQQVPTRLLPRELGSPSVYGSAWIGDLLASPADLLLTGIGLYLVCIAIRICCAAKTATERPLAGIVSAVAAGAATIAAVGLTVSLARDSRVALIDRPAPFDWDTRLPMWIGLVLVLIGAAELIALFTATTRLGWIPKRRGAGAIPVGLALLPLAAGAGLLLQVLSDRVALEQLRSEIAPQVREQQSRRQLALAAAMQEVQSAFENDPGSLDANPTQPGYLAYRYWVGSELFHSGYKSSIDIYSADGLPLSHFGFDLPPVDETLETIERPDADSLFRVEPVRLSGGEHSWFHQEMPLIRDAQLVAIAVGHVLDEYDNLPFLPGSQPYLAALGPGAPRLTGETLTGEPQYVLYDAFGTVRLTTVRRPPVESSRLREAAGDRQTIRVVAGEEAYTGLTIEDEDGRLHLLMLPRRTVVEHLGGMSRAALLGLIVLFFLTLAGRTLRGRRLGGALDVVRASFYRKILAAFLIASVVPLVTLALFLRGYAKHRADVALSTSATQIVSTVQRVVEDYSREKLESAEPVGELDDDLVLHWLARVVGQEIHVYDEGRLQASSKRELFSSGLLPTTLEGEVYRSLIDEGLPHVVASMRMGPSTIPVAYAPVRAEADPSNLLVVAVPLVVEERERERDVARVTEMILLATLALAGLLAVAAAVLARTLARPVRELVGATARIASGDYGERLDETTQDEVAELVRGFNSMSTALSRQRRDLERRRDYIETLLRHATTGVVSLDPDGVVVTMNPAAGALLDAGTPGIEVGSDLVAALAQTSEGSPLADALTEPRSRRGEPVDVDLVRGQEPRRLRLVQVALERTSGGSYGTLLLVDDVTDLMRSNQLAAWAEMARAIAHEIKNPLTPIQLSTDHLRRLLADREKPPTPDEEACLETITKQVRALYDIAGEFSAYAKLPVLAPEPTDPAAFMRTVVGPYRTGRPPGVEIVEDYAEAPPIHADGRVLSRALINLVENALHAMADGGTLTVGVRYDEPRRRIELSVRDTGPGLDPVVRVRLFEPYFSTKSSGTGLGLAIARRAVEAHHGTIDVESEPGQGTTFRIRLPAAAVVAAR